MVIVDGQWEMLSPRQRVDVEALRRKVEVLSIVDSPVDVCRLRRKVDLGSRQAHLDSIRSAQKSLTSREISFGSFRVWPG